MWLQNLFQTIYNFIISNLGVLIKILIIVGLASLAIRFDSKLQQRFESRIIDAHVDPGQRSRLKTLMRAGIAALNVVIAVTAILMILIVLGINITPLLASVGIAGLAISLGAQTLIKDYIGGALILFENQFNVGDDIQVGNVLGTVERMELRATYVRDSQGKLFTIPNGDMRTLSNNSRDWSKAQVDLNLAFDTDLDAAMHALNIAIQKTSTAESLQTVLIEAPQIQGWNSMNDWAVQVRLTAKTLPGKQSDAAVVLRQQALIELRTAGIQLAVPPYKTVN